MPPTGPQLAHAIKRNFGGLEQAGLNPEGIFRKYLAVNIDELPYMSNIDSHVKTFTYYCMLVLFPTPIYIYR